MGRRVEKNSTLPTVDEMVAAHGDLKPKGGSWAGPCPNCGGDDRFHVKDRGDGTALWGCRGCYDPGSREERKQIYRAVMADLFPERLPPPRMNGSAKAAHVAPEQPKTREGLRQVLGALGYEWRYNTRRMRDELCQAGGAWREANDRLIRDIRSQIPERFAELGKDKPLMFGREAFDDCFGALLNRAEVDPFQEWLEALPKWKGETRLDRWLWHVFEVSDAHKSLAEWAARFLMLGAVWRTYRPGTKLDEMPVLIGPQGCGKSTALRELVPPEHPEWFSDGLRLAADDKVRAEALQGRVIVEAAEMAGSTRAERESLKAFLSRQDDGSVRLAFRRNPETMLRRCVLAGTSNDPQCLPPDPSGNRRFVALPVQPVIRCGLNGAAHVRAYFKEFREQLWAEALVRYRDGERAFLPAELVSAQAALNAGAVSVDETLEDALLAFLANRPREEPFRLHDVKRHTGRALEGVSDKRLSAELQRVGCEALGRQRVNGRLGRWWVFRVPLVPHESL